MIITRNTDNQTSIIVNRIIKKIIYLLIGIYLLGITPSFYGNKEYFSTIIFIILGILFIIHFFLNIKVYIK